MPESMPLHDPRIVPPPPRLHWGVVLALQIVTLGLFQLVWFVVQALWVKRISGKSRSFVWALINLSVLPILLVILMVSAFVLIGIGREADAVELTRILTQGYRVLFLITNLFTVFTMYGQMQEWPISMSLNGVATLFFQCIYFQYRLNNYVLPNANDVFGEIPGAPVYVPPILPEAEQL
ncbi:MAG: hypothetical protein V4734_12210 [Terriglobus sp.]